MQHLTVVLLVVAAAAAVAVAEPEPEQPANLQQLLGAHHLQKRNLKNLLHKAHVKLSHAAHNVAHKVAPNLQKLKDCLKRTPGVPAAVQGVVTGCASSASGGMGAIAACAAKKAAIPAARATSHLAVCMG